MMNKKGFTLVELIVVITILAILGTIAFIAFNGYTKSARDSKRVADINAIKSGLELFTLQAGYYPEPTGYSDISFSGSQVWIQGTIGDSFISNLNKINKKPVDPLTETEYVYSRLNTKGEFEIGSILEGDSIGYNSSQVYAAGKRASAYITGNYNGKTAKVTQGEITYILAIPSIINGQISLIDIQQVINQNRLLYTGFSNLPEVYTGSTFDTNGEGDLILVNSGSLVAYTGSIDDLASDIDAQVLVLKAIQDAYVGTDLVGVDNRIDEIVNMNINTSTPSDNDKFQASTLLKYETGIDDIVVTGFASVGPSLSGSDYCLANLTQADADYLNANMQVDSSGVGGSGGGYGYGGGGPEVLSIAQRCGLTTVDMSADNTFGPIPIELGKLRGITEFRVDSGNITSIPSEIGNLNFLERLYIYNTAIATLPASVGNLSSLSLFVLQNNSSLTTLPSEIGDLSSLSYFGIGDSLSLLSLPSEIGNLSSLVDFYINNTGLSSLPNEIGDMSSLNTLSIMGTPLGGLPAYIGNSPSLHTLDIRNSSLTSLPNELGDILTLEVLVIEGGGLTTLPAQLGNLPSLRILIVEDNDLSSLPTEIGDILSLNRLELNDNLLTSLPSSLENLVNLNGFYLGGNTGLGNISTTFSTPGGSIATQTNVTDDNRDMTINAGGANIVITVTP